MFLYILVKNIKEKNKPKIFNKFIEFYDKLEISIYLEAGYVIEGLISKYGKNKLLTLIKGIKKVKTNISFKKLFEEIYGFKLTYKNINLFLNKN